MKRRLIVLGLVLTACSLPAQPAAACHPESIDGAGASQPNHHGCGGPKDDPAPAPGDGDPKPSPDDSVDNGAGNEPASGTGGDATGGAEAARVRECGDLQNEGAGVYNVTSRRIRCPRARRVARRYYRNGRRNGRTLGFRCREKQLGTELFDVRCTRAGGRVVRFQFGS